MEFLSDIKRNTPSLVDYMFNARANGKYDFKLKDYNSVIDKKLYIYRGMPIGKNKNGQTVYSSARDIGNMTAGYIAGINGLPWFMARMGFDGYQSYQSYQTNKSFNIEIEGISTRNAEFYGWRIGTLSPQFYKIYHNTKSRVTAPWDIVINTYKILNK